jgi:protein ImuB
MSLRLPRFALERRLRACQQTATTAARATWPVALSAREGPREIVVAATAAAEQAGVRAGMGVAAARALCGALRVLRDDPARDARVQLRLAVRLLRFTPDVVLDGPGAFLLEIGRTAHHFRAGAGADDGEEALARGAREFMRELGFTARLGVAATPEAARTLARAPRTFDERVDDGALDPATGTFDADAPVFAPGDDPAPSLAGLPWSALAPDREAADACAALGLATIGDVLWLPRSGLAQRCGVPFVQKLQRLLGELDEPLVRITPPELFDEELELVDAATSAPELLFAARRLFEAAEAELERRDHALIRATLTLVPLGRATATVATAPTATVIVLAPSEPSRSAALLLRLLQHRLERERVAAPIEKLRLVFTATAPLHLAQERLFEAARDRAFEQEAAALRDRLAVRLGEARVVALDLVADHRPEHAFRLRRFGESAVHEAAGSVDAARESAAVAAGGARPLDLWDAPRPVWVERDDRGFPLALRADGRVSRLALVRGPERIAAGWWDGRDAERAYFEVETEEGARLWLFLDRREDAWYQHGTFS